MTRRTRHILFPALALALLGCQVSGVPTKPAADGSSESTVHAPSLAGKGGDAAAVNTGSANGPVALNGNVSTGSSAGATGGNASTTANAGTTTTADGGTAIAAGTTTGTSADGNPLAGFKIAVEPADAAASQIPTDPRAAQARALMLSYKADALSKSEPMSVAAASGGVFKSADGKLTATVPPGALTSDAKIKIAPMDTSLLDSPGVYNPGIMFAADLGGATLAPGTAITVTMPVASDFVARCQKLDPNFTPAAYQLSQDADGKWNMSMQILGPTQGAGPTAPQPVSNPNLFEWGSLPGATVAPAPKLNNRALLGVSVSDDGHGLTAAETTESNGCSLPLWMVVHNESLGVWGCGSVPHEDICWDLTSPPVRGLSFAGRWVSDDPAFNGHGISGMGIHVDYSFEEWEALNLQEGAHDLVTDGNGNASTYSAYGTYVTATASHPIASPQSGSARMNGNISMTFTLPHMKPVITLHIGGGDGIIPSSLLVHYTLAGVDHTDTIATGSAAGSRAGDVTFTVAVPGEDTYDMTLIDAKSADDSVARLTAPPETHGVRTNGSASFSFALISLSSK